LVPPYSVITLLTVEPKNVILHIEKEINTLLPSNVMCFTWTASRYSRFLGVIAVVASLVFAMKTAFEYGQPATATPPANGTDIW